MSAVLQPPAALKLFTAAEFADQYAQRRFELVRGVPVETPTPNLRHGKVCTKIARFLDTFSEERDLGHVMSNDSFVKVENDPDTLRGADVLFISYERLPKGRVLDGVLDVIPDLAVEVVSPSDVWTKLFGKVHEYLDAGVKAVVILDPRSQTASVYRPDVVQQVFAQTDTLTVPEVLPGFSVPVAKLFE
jgi:Uma2 family endonuclease